MTAVALVLLVSGCVQQTPDLAASTTEKTLKELAAARNLRIGAVYQDDIRDDTYATTLAREYNVLTVYVGWEAVHHSSRRSYDFNITDRAVDFGVKNGFEIHGHPLVWYEHIAEWVKDVPLSQVETVMDEHIDTVVGRYAGRVKLWDVVNEAVDDNGGSLRLGHAWSDAMGNDYISKAFIRVHKADPKAILRYNDFGMESSEAKFSGVKTLLRDLRAKGVPVHALGWQMHLRPGFDHTMLLARMSEIADMGVDNYITELDVELPVHPTAQDYEEQKRIYKSVVSVFLKAHRHKTLVVWGVRDGGDQDWLTKNHPLPLNEKFEKKPAYFGIQEALLEK